MTLPLDVTSNVTGEIIVYLDKGQFNLIVILLTSIVVLLVLLIMRAGE